jgi:hypothetical protein
VAGRGHAVLARVRCLTGGGHAALAWPRARRAAPISPRRSDRSFAALRSATAGSQGAVERCTLITDKGARVSCGIVVVEALGNAGAGGPLG